MANDPGVEGRARNVAERYRRLVETSRDVMFSLEPDGTISLLNPAFEAITGFPRAQWEGRALGPLLHPDDLGTAMELMSSALAGEHLPIFELRIRTRSGGYVVGEFTVTPEQEDGRVVGVLGVARDVTERRRTEKAIRDGEQEFRAFLEFAPDGMVVVDADGRIVLANVNLPQ